MKLHTLSFFLVGLLLLAGCRASGPGKPARTVAEFFSKYEHRSGFKATDWNAGLVTRLMLGRLGKLAGNNDVAQALTSIRNARVLTFSPTTNRAQNLVAEGLIQEVDGLLANERYTPLTVDNTDQTSQLRYSVREQGGRVSEFVAVGNVRGVPDSFMLVSVGGNFTREQVAQLAKVLPNVVLEAGNQ
ncbi:DUF4252 domain-containing protein [Hymenobacter weizhouensis]|uniref:DUF4252 domain-containing protein n=1 Tax=Hymenobacter sp. YIM 151500-1 TaxID=2987689 RepID=UPI00222689BE|nr:DUF4252 domain-containing protein [Hymenobacter sp. YIM 151500-1]UYZ63170.1 DUF4252 domain-containing protein [Hymenobacter sp. YIM 151500-1]